jgi:hypothetical protein
VAARDLGTLEIENAGRQRYCGVHAVVMVARMLGKHIEVSELLDNQNVSSNGGSTLADLCRMIDGQGFERQVLADASLVGWKASRLQRYCTFGGNWTSRRSITGLFLAVSKMAIID